MRKLSLINSFPFNIKFWIAAVGILTAVVCTADIAATATFKTVNGEVVIEAEQYTRLGGTIGGKWFRNTAIAGYNGDGYLESQKNDPTTLVYKEGIIRAEYDIDFKSAGTYYLHLRTYARDHTQNGFFATIDGQQINYGGGRYVYVRYMGGKWWWYTDGGGAEQRGLKLSFYVSSPGKKTFALIRRDKGTRVDRIWLTKNQSVPQNTDDINRPDPSTFIVTGGTTPTPPAVELCSDGKDNDGDGLIDCRDSDCDNDPNCYVPSTETSCSDGIDNDEDGKTDCADSDCANAAACTPSSEGNCSDGIDNDGDGATDCADSDCSTSAACSSALYTESFDGGQGSFYYEDDVFYGTSRPAYAEGSYAANGGHTGGGLYIALGGVDYANITNGMSGGWSDEFSVQNSGTVNISFRYRLITNRYDTDECGEVIVAVDDKPITVNGNDYVQKFCGRNDSGWQQISVDVDLSVGLHKLTIGGFNNKKTAALEITEIFIDDIIISGSEGSGSTPEPPDADEFSYSDDTFRNTRNGFYASGSTEGGALKVSLGGIDGVDITDGISGGWKSSFTTSTSGTVQIDLMYRLITNRYDDDECGQALVSVDGKLYGIGGRDYLEQICGVGDSGWQQASLSVDLGAGNHTLIVGGYNSKKTGPNEVTEVLFQSIEITQ